MFSDRTYRSLNKMLLGNVFEQEKLMKSEHNIVLITLLLPTYQCHACIVNKSIVGSKQKYSTVHKVCR